LNVVQELLELFDIQQADDSDAMSSQSEHLFMAISEEAVSGGVGPRTMQFQGVIQNQEVSILIDSGSSHTFVSESLAAKLSGVCSLLKGSTVQVANGGTMQCVSCIPDALWSVGGYMFQSNMKVLPLAPYDLVIGMDWLEAQSPMQVHWAHKWMLIPYEDSTALLQGYIPDSPEAVVLQLCFVEEPTSGPSTISTQPEGIAAILHEFSWVFEPVTELPPQRVCDHEIPLVQGAKPVHIRSYRYPPALKDEIERQVAEMLAKGIIQPSVSEFASPVLLVKKKDGTWRFCVDYRYLNASQNQISYPSV